MIITIWE